jgi:hypothetical protein
MCAQKTLKKYTSLFATAERPIAGNHGLVQEFGMMPHAAPGALEPASCTTVCACVHEGDIP